MRRVVRGLAASIATVALMVAPSSSSAAVTVGSDLAAAATSTANDQTLSSPVIPGRTAVSPVNGVIHVWRIRTSTPSGDTARLRVLRPVADGSVLGAGTGPAVPVAGGTESFFIGLQGLPVQAGDWIGIDNGPGAAPADDGAVVLANTPGASLATFSPFLADGTAAPPGFVPGELLVNADVEPDCDGDLLGDETQDSDTSICNPDTTPPDTTFTTVPKNKVKTFSRRADVLFEFVSSEPGATFECKLDKDAFAPCVSPHVLKAKAKRRKPKKHEFEVRGIDAAGNADPTPAADRFKVKRKKK